MKTCFLMGAHDAPERLQEQLMTLIEYLIEEKEVREFVVGRHGQFDKMAISAIQHGIRKSRDKKITALLLEPYPFQGKPYLPACFHGFYTPEGMESVPKRFCIEAANKKALDGSSVFVTYSYLPGSNSGKLLRRARRLEKNGLELYILEDQ